jgi:pSer/pThr/pTyr-binding forkhead associated (FHA) protein
VSGRASTASIEITHCDGRKETFSFAPGSYTVGRIQCDITVTDDRNLSRSHAKLEILHKAVRLEDLGSACGTFDANGLRIEQPYTMRAGDCLVLGRTKLQILSVAEVVPGCSDSSAMTQPELELDLSENEALR